VPRRAWHGQGLTRWHAQLFAEGLEHARRHAQRFGHLALAHTERGVVEGFDLGRWLARRRADAASLTVWQTAQLVQLDPWWNPPWGMDWQRAWHRARAYAGEHGLVHGGDNLGGLPRWLELWLRRQITRYAQLHEGQQRLLAELGLTSGEVQRFQAWSGRRRPVGEAFPLARAYAARRPPPAAGTSPCPEPSPSTDSRWAHGGAAFPSRPHPPGQGRLPRPGAIAHRREDPALTAAYLAYA
jgi:hypothetical protein